MRARIWIIFSILIGIAITLVSGAFMNPFGDEIWVFGVTMAALKSDAGFPLPWLVYPQLPYTERFVVLQINLVCDIVVWSIISWYIISFVGEKDDGEDRKAMMGIKKPLRVRTR